MTRPGIIICSRNQSSRIPNKPFQIVAGKPILQHLLDILKVFNIPICVAIPECDRFAYSNFNDPDLLWFYGDEDSPLHRMLPASFKYDIDPIIRITHDKIFIDRDRLADHLASFQDGNLDYLFDSSLIDGTGFEIFSRDLLLKAVERFPYEPVEHISYALKAVNPKLHDAADDRNIERPSDIRLLIDFPEDLELIRQIYSHSSYSDSSTIYLYDALRVLRLYPYLKQINQQPKITIYTCVFNGQATIDRCIESVTSQTIFSQCEYLIIDDASTDRTYEKILSSEAYKAGRLKVTRNESNLGLSSSSNLALNKARGKYIVRVDVDDMLLFASSLDVMFTDIEARNLDALYPSFLDDRTKQVVEGNVSHHAGCCLFKTRAVRDILFTEKLRALEGRDLFARAKDKIKIGYFKTLPTFFYADSDGSLSKTNLERRRQIEELLNEGYSGSKLVEMT